MHDSILESVNAYKNAKWKKVTFTIWNVITPSSRPRARRMPTYIKMYVPHARSNGEWFEKFAKENNLPYVETPCILNMKIYCKTPKLSIKNTVLAELGIIRPIGHTGDFDNYAKTISDAMQHGMLKDDCLIISSKQDLYYSIKPRAEIELIYMESMPSY